MAFLLLSCQVEAHNSSLLLTQNATTRLHTKLLHLTALGGVVSSSCHWAENLRLGPALFPASETTRWASHFISL